MKDVEVWRVVKGTDRTIICRQREISMPAGWDSYVALELRVEHNGEIFRTETHKERVTFVERVTELRRMLEAEGWTHVQQEG